jgi:heat-inducible transcriptional repressor
MIRLSDRSKEIFRTLIDAYCETGEAVGSRTLCERLEFPLSPATIRSVMADLEDLGLLYSPHTSAGRLPTEEGLRFFIDGLLEIQNLSESEKESLEKHCLPESKNPSLFLEKTSSVLASLSKCMSLVLVPKGEAPLKHIEFIGLSPTKVLAVLVNQEESIENRLIDVPEDLPAAILIEASNYLNSRLSGKNIKQARQVILKEIEDRKTQLNTIAAKLVEIGLEILLENTKTETLIIKGQSHLLEDINHLGELEKVRSLFSELETKENIIRLLDAAIEAKSIQIFIGSNNPVQEISDNSIVVAPYYNSDNNIIGAIGVVGPRHLKYGRVIPLLDYTAKIIGKSLG